MTFEPSTSLAWHHPIKGAGTRDVTVDREATPAECEALTSGLDIVSVEAFHARYAITAQSAGCFLMAGDFTARLTQACVVTLEPVVQTIAETFSVSFCPPGRIAQPDGKDRPILDEPDVEDLTGDTIEAGRVLFELLSASLDPYPRKGAAAFAWKDPKTGPEVEMQLNPFAALSKLKPSGH